MVVENPVPPFSSWIGLASLTWLLVVLGVALAGLLLGFLIALLRHGPARAVRLTGRAIAGAVEDLVRMSPRRVWALASLAFREAVRRKVLVGFLVFVVILLFASWFLDPDSDEPARLYMSFVLTASSYPLLLLVLLLSVFSIPADIRSRTLHTVVTKPVRPSEIVLGRMLGFTLLGTALLAVMAIISYVFVVRGLAHTHSLAAENLRPVTQVHLAPGAAQPMVGETDKVHGHKHTVRIDSAGNARVEPKRRHWHEIFVEQTAGGTKYRIGPEQGSLRARVPIYGKLSFRDREGFDAKEGISVGYEWTYRSYIQGGSPAAAIWTFERLRPEMFRDHVPVELNLEVFRTHKGNMERQVLGSLGVRNPDTGLFVSVTNFQSNEFLSDEERAIQPLSIPLLMVRKKVAGIDVIQRKSKTPEGGVALSPNDPHRLKEAQDLRSQLKEEDAVDLFRDVVTRDGRMEIWVQCVEPGQYFGAAQADLYLPAPDASFMLNFLVKGYLGIWLQMLLVIGFGVMFSTFLSGPVAMIATIGALVGGLFKPFMVKLATGEQIGGGPIEALIRLVQQQNLVSELAPTLGAEVAQSLDVVYRVGLRGMAAVLPSFGDFSYANFVADGFNIGANTLLVHGVEALAYFVPVFVAGYLFMKMREVAR